MPEGAWLPMERRTVFRYRTDDSSPPLTVVHSNHHRPAMLHDISAEGVGVLLDRAIDAGELIRVEIHSRANHCWYLKQARVVHVTPQPGGTWLAGIAFLVHFEERDVPAAFTEYGLVVAESGPVRAALAARSY